MTIEEMTTISCVLFIIAVVVGMVAAVLFFTLKIPKAYQVVKRQKGFTKKYTEKRNPSTVKLSRNWQHEDKTEVLNEDIVHFTMLQDITYVHAKEDEKIR